MAELIDRAALLADLAADADVLKHARELIRLRIAEAPAVDAVEVVRCKDCYAACDKYQGEILRKEGSVYCLIHEECELPDEYCSYGRRKEGRG